MAVKIYTDAESVGIYMEQWALIYLFAFKGLKARTIHIEFESAYGLETLALPTVKKWRRRFHQGGTDLADNPRSKRSLANHLAGAISFMLEGRPFSSCMVLCHQFPIGKAT
jgi:hypothetical protein